MPSPQSASFSSGEFVRSFLRFAQNPLQFNKDSSERDKWTEVCAKQHPDKNSSGCSGLRMFYHPWKSSSTLC